LNSRYETKKHTRQTGTDALPIIKEERVIRISPTLCDKHTRTPNFFGLAREFIDSQHDIMLAR
jgi:hypothetical protein